MKAWVLPDDPQGGHQTDTRPCKGTETALLNLNIRTSCGFPKKLGLRLLNYNQTPTGNFSWNSAEEQARSLPTSIYLGSSGRSITVVTDDLAIARGQLKTLIREIDYSCCYNETN